MKHRLLAILLFSLCFAFNANAQSPQGIYYQAVVRDSSGNLVQNKPVRFRFNIHDVNPNGSVAYQQVDSVITDQMGLIVVVLGSGGSYSQGNFGNIPWAVGNKFLQVELDANGGTSYTDMGTTQMLSVPYALYAASAGNGDTLWKQTGTNIYNANTGNVGIHTTTPNAALEVNGFSILGDNGAPKIKMKRISGITPSLLGGSTSINLGIPDSSIISVTVELRDPIQGLIAPLSNLLGQQYTYSIAPSLTSAVFKLTTSLTGSLVTSKPFKALIIYEQ